MKSIYVYGAGASAKYFIQQYHSKYHIKAIIDIQAGSQLENIPVQSADTLNDTDYDLIVVASWAINEIRARLENSGVDPQRIVWFQHNKNRIVASDHPDALMGHSAIDSSEVMYSFYDLNVARATYDVLGFLCLADIAREKEGCKYLHIIIVPARDNEFNIAARGIIARDEHYWRKQQILIQSCALLPACAGVSAMSCQSEVQQLLDSAEHVFPEQYKVTAPIACWEFNHLFYALNETSKIARLQSSARATSLVTKYLAINNPRHKKVLTITLRESEIKPARNSDVKAWKRFVKSLDKDTYFPVIVPDTEDSWSLDLQDFDSPVFSEACFNVELRMALYELSHINLGVNNGPLHLCAFSEHCRYLMFKQVTEDYAHTSTKSFEERGFTIGRDFPGANKFQKLIWQDDDVDVIQHAFWALENLISDSSQEINLNE